MSTLVTEHEVFAESVQFSDDAMTVHLDDGRSISVPLAWYPRLLHGTSEERQSFHLIGDGEGIHWPALDEDISVEGLLAGGRPAKTDASLSRWLQQRKKGEAARHQFRGPRTSGTAPRSPPRRQPQNSHATNCIPK